METILWAGLGNALAAGVLAMGAAAAGVFARRRPALRHGLWLIVLLKLVTPSLWTVPVARVAPAAAAADPPTRPAPRLLAVPVVELEGIPPRVDEPGGADDATAAPGETGAGPPGDIGMSWESGVLLAWGAGTLLTSVVAAGRIRRFRRLLRLAEPASAETRDRVEILARRLGLGRAPGVWSVPGAVSPMLWAMGCRPRLIVPAELWDRLDGRRRDTLLAHELAHLKRRDHWVRWLELLVTGLYWWFPPVWIARHALREAEEQSCDAWVVWAIPGAARTYAEALLETVDFLSGVEPAVPTSASGLGQVGHLKRRMTMILQGTTPRAMTWGGLLAVLGLSATLLPLSPTWAQQRPAPGVEEAFYGALEEDHEYNNPSWPFLIKVKELQGKTLVGATFKHRAAGPEGANAFDMIVQSGTARVDFDHEKGVARVRLDGAEVINPREDVSLSASTLEIPFSTVSEAEAVDDEDEETSDSKPGKPEARDPGPRPRRERDEPRPIGPRAEGDRPAEVRPDRRDGDRPGPMRPVRVEIFRKEMAPDLAGRKRSAGDEGDAKRESAEAKERRARGREAVPSRGPFAKDVEIEIGSDDRQADLKRLREEVESRRAELREAEMRLAKAMKQLAEAARSHVNLEGENRVFRVSPMLPHKPGADFDRIPHKPGADAELLPHKPGVDAEKPGQEKRIAELEERLERLMAEVKSMKKDTPSREK